MRTWKVVNYDNCGVMCPLNNPAKNYTLLVNTNTKEYVVAYFYDPKTNTWGQGHYFSDFYDAMAFMFSND